MDTRCSTAVESRGLTWSLDPGVDFVIQAHFMLLEEEVDVRLRVGLYFGEAPAEGTRLVKNMYLLGRTIDIPAGNSRYRVEDRFEVPVDVEFLGLYPHAHYLARTMEFEAVLPNGIERTLIRIEEWDFDWQDMYTFESPVALPIAAGWMLAADPDAVVRQPRYAIRVAEELDGALGEDHPLVLDLLAAAHAAAGDFDQALRFAIRCSRSGRGFRTSSWLISQH